MAKTNDRNLLDLISKCLDWNPETRITPSQALNHRFFQEMRPKIEIKRGRSHKFPNLG